MYSVDDKQVIYDVNLGHDTNCFKFQSGVNNKYGISFSSYKLYFFTNFSDETVIINNIRNTILIL